MDSFDSNRVDISEIYMRYCGKVTYFTDSSSLPADSIRSGNAYQEGSSCLDHDELQKLKFSRDELAELLKVVQKKMQNNPRFSIFDELRKLMSNPRLVVDFYDFSCLYDFVFFICRENGQKNLTVNKAVTAWRLVLAGRFRLLNQWCDFVERNQRYNISEDTWRQVLAFSRCVHENLEGYDPEGAWPVLVDEFVEHMYRTSGSKNNYNSSFGNGDLESHLCAVEDLLPGSSSIFAKTDISRSLACHLVTFAGLKVTPGLKRKSGQDKMEICDPAEANLYSSNSKRNRVAQEKMSSLSWMDNSSCDSGEDGMDGTRQNSPVGCAVENCLSKGFAGLFSGGSYLKIDQERRVSSI
ncbi:Defective in cullin neddylation protein AAR3 [Linum perenne]